MLFQHFFPGQNNNWWFSNNSFMKWKREEDEEDEEEEEVFVLNHRWEELLRVVSTMAPAILSRLHAIG